MANFILPTSNASTVLAVHGLRQFTVQSSYKLNIPSSLMIPSCNLKLGSTLGQGKLILTVCNSYIATMHTIICMLNNFNLSTCPGEFGVVYKGYLKSGISDAISDTVAVKTLKGKSTK